ncbi:hypothetical protein QA640_23060 [Bradyrhizobium sp. CB82]|uniref:hypothetical protein n=1 Tax=Bradyrhizobium sp. CB82 TaxID=3039159 RepID=UPI0024B16DDE|nr:hypothetical protein [Bradyrhizobium sp. CB82]WFU37373.1 hypothetical protein QA640_23060 [Bradyrhizobium sp. CB82]
MGEQTFAAIWQVAQDLERAVRQRDDVVTLAGALLVALQAGGGDRPGGHHPVNLGPHRADRVASVYNQGVFGWWRIEAN